MKKILEKLTSRKLWMAVAGVATGIAVVMGANAGDVSAVAGAVTAVVSVVTYIVTEGKIDAEGVKNAAQAVQDAADRLEVGFRGGDE